MALSAALGILQPSKTSKQQLVSIPWDQHVEVREDYKGKDFEKRWVLRRHEDPMRHVNNWNQILRMEWSSVTDKAHEKQEIYCAIEVLHVQKSHLWFWDSTELAGKESDQWGRSGDSRRPDGNDITKVADWRSLRVMEITLYSMLLVPQANARMWESG